MHHILKPVFDFYYNFKVQNNKKALSQSTEWVKRLLLPVVESVFDEFDTKGVIIRIEKIDINLGDINLENIDYELPTRFQNALREAIQKKIIQHRFSLKTELIENLSEIEHIRELLVYYLGSGRGSWRLDRLSKELEKYFLSKGVDLTLYKNTARGIFGEPVGTSSRIFNFEVFWEIINQTEPEFLWNWFEEFNTDDNIKKRMIRQIKTEKIWEWLAGKDFFSLQVLQNTFLALSALNDYTWQIPEKQLKGIFTETILDIWDRKDNLSIFLNKDNNISNFFTSFLKKQNTHYNIIDFIKNYFEGINKFIAYRKDIASNIIYIFSQTHVLQYKKQKINDFFNNKDFVSGKKSSDFIENTLNEYFSQLSPYIPISDGVFYEKLKHIIISFLENRQISNFNYADLVNNTFAVIHKSYLNHIKVKYNESSNVEKETKYWTDNYTEIQAKVLNKKNTPYSTKKEALELWENTTELSNNNVLPEKKLISLLQEIEPKFAQPILTFIRELASKYKWANVNPLAFKQKIWEFVAQYLLYNQSTPFDFTIFIRTILLQIQNYYALQETAIQAIASQIHLAETKNIAEENLEKNIEEWRRLWHKISVWESFSLLIVKDEKLINQDVILRLFFYKDDRKVLELAKKIKNIFQENKHSISVEKILIYWLEYRWLKKNNKFIFQKEKTNLLEIILNNIPVNFKNNENIIIQKILEIAVNNSNFEKLNKKYNDKKNDTIPIFIKNIENKQKTEIFDYLQNIIPTKIYWIKDMISLIIRNKTDDNFEIMLWKDIALFILNSYKKNIEIDTNNILVFLYKYVKEYEYDEASINKLNFLKEIKEEVIKRNKYTLHVLIHFIKTGEWLWSESIKISNSKDINTRFSKMLSNILENTSTTNQFLIQLSDLPTDKIIFFINYAFKSLKDKTILGNFIKFLDNYVHEKSSKINEYVLFLENLFVYKSNKQIEFFLENKIKELIKDNIEISLVSYTKYIYFKEYIINLESKVKDSTTEQLENDKIKNEIYNLEITKNEKIELLNQKISNIQYQKEEILQSLKSKIKKLELEQNEKIEDITKDLNKLDIEMLSRKFLLLKKEHHTKFQLLENKINRLLQQDEILSKGIWAKLYQNPIPNNDFLSLPLEKQANILFPLLENPNKILFLINIYFSKNIKNLPIPEAWIRVLRIENLVEVLIQYFPDVFIVWFNSLSENKKQYVQKNNPKSVVLWDDNNKILRKELDIIQQNIQNDAYLPPQISEKLQENREDLKKLAKKLDASTKKWINEPLYIQNAGLVILYPFLPRLFDIMGLLENGKFKSDWEASKAVYMLEYLVHKEYENIDEANLVLNKILCGIPIHQPLWKEVELTEKEKGIGESLLKGVIQNWAILGNATPDALRYSFLQREGRLIQEKEDWGLRVEQKGTDILVERLPWGLGMIKTPFMSYFLRVEWT